jgi:hypothetical protein
VNGSSDISKPNSFVSFIYSVTEVPFLPVVEIRWCATSTNVRSGYDKRKCVVDVQVADMFNLCVALISCTSDAVYNNRLSTKVFM